MNIRILRPVAAARALPIVITFATALLLWEPAVCSAKEYWAICELNIRETPDGTIIGTYSAGEQVDVTDDSGEWFRTAEGYSWGAYLSPEKISYTGYENLEYDPEEFPLEYLSDDLEITVFREEGYDTVWYAADVILEDPARLQTIYPDGQWGNLAQAVRVDAGVHSILMVNGDFRTPDNAKKRGIIRGGKIINKKKMKTPSIGLTTGGDLVSVDGMKASKVVKSGIRETWTFGPLLVKDGQSVADDNPDEHPRTFIGQVVRDDDRKEYWIIVADGRWPGYSTGLTYAEMAEILLRHGCNFGYNLDGGGSSVMLFEGKVVNKPADGVQRSDADYIYIK